MRRASYFTPVYLFSSISAGCGKSTILSNLAVLLNKQGVKVAIIDFASENVKSLPDSFPKSVEIQDYPELSQLVLNEGSKFQKNFYFIETDFISYFPAGTVKNLSTLFTETSLRDFFIQLRSTFDTIIINMPSGARYWTQISETIANSSFWQGTTPVCITVSSALSSDMVAIDNSIRESTLLNYQMKENTVIVFNIKAPPVPDPNNANLNASEIRNLFDFPLSFIIQNNQEFLEQSFHPLPFVLESGSQTNQIISSFYRVISHTSDTLSHIPRHKKIAYTECSGGPVFDLIADYLPQIYDLISSRFFTITTSFQIYLEESENSYAIKVSISENRDRNLGIYDKKEQTNNFQKQFYFSPKYFAYDFVYSNKNDFFDDAQKYEPEKVIGHEKTYSFDDKSCLTTFKTITLALDLYPGKDRFLSPLVMSQSHYIHDIPTLAHMLALPKNQKKKYIAPNYLSHTYSLANVGITPFIIPTFFKFNFTFECCLPTFFLFNMSKTVLSKFLFNFVFSNNSILAKSRISAEQTMIMYAESLRSQWLVSKTLSHKPLFFNSYNLSLPQYGMYKIPFTGSIKLEEAEKTEFIISSNNDDPTIKKELTVSSLVLSKPNFSYNKAALNYAKDENLSPTPNLENYYLQAVLNVPNYCFADELFCLKIFYPKALVEFPKNLVLRRAPVITKSVLFDNNSLPEPTPPEKKLALSSLNRSIFLRASKSFAAFKTNFDKNHKILSSEFCDVPYDFINFANSMLPMCFNFKIYGNKVSYSTIYNKAQKDFSLTFKTLFKINYISKENNQSVSAFTDISKRKTIDFSISVDIKKPYSEFFSNENNYKYNSKQQHSSISTNDKSYLSDKESIPLLKSIKEKIKICPKGMLEIIPRLSTFSPINLIFQNKEFKTTPLKTPKTVNFEYIVSSDLIFIVPNFELLTYDKKIEALVSQNSSYSIASKYLIKKSTVQISHQIQTTKIEQPKLNYGFKKLLNQNQLGGLFLLQNPIKINISTSYLASEMNRMLTEMHLRFTNFTNPYPLRKLSPQISQIRPADKLLLTISKGIFNIISSHNFNLETLQPTVSLKKDLSFRAAYYDSNTVCFQVPLLVKSLKMNNFRPVFQTKRPDLFENLHSTIVVNLHSKLRHINFSSNKIGLKRKVSVSPISFSHIKVFPTFNALNFSDKSIVKRFNLFQNFKRESYEINKIKAKDILLWAQSTAKRLKSVNLSVNK